MANLIANNLKTKGVAAIEAVLPDWWIVAGSSFPCLTFIYPQIVAIFHHPIRAATP